MVMKDVVDAYVNLFPGEQKFLNAAKQFFPFD